MTPELRSALRDVVADATMLPAMYIDEPREFAGAGAHSLIELRAVERQGAGTAVDADAEGDETTTEHTRFIASIRVESFDHEIHAQDRLMRARSRFDRQYIRHALEAAGACVMRSSPIQTLSTSYDKRMRSVAVLEVTMHALVVETQEQHDTLLGRATAPGAFQAVEFARGDEPPTTVGEPVEDEDLEDPDPEEITP